MRPFIVILAIIFGLATAARAAEPKYSPAHKTCMDASGSVTMKMRDCLTKETKRWEVRLNRAYSAIIGKLEPKQKSKLVTAQNAWLQYLKANCWYYASETGGSIDVYTSNNCWLRLTAHRTLELERLLKTQIEMKGK